MALLCEETGLRPEVYLRHFQLRRRGFIEEIISSRELVKYEVRRHKETLRNDF